MTNAGASRHLSGEEILALVPAPYRSLLRMSPLTPEQAWINQTVAALVKAAKEGGCEHAQSKLRNLLEMTEAGRFASARESMAASGEPSPSYRLKARDQATGREYPMEVGYLDVLCRRGAWENARGRDYWVEDERGQEVDSTGQPVPLPIPTPVPAVAATPSPLAGFSEAQLIGELRARGCAVVVWEAGDMEGFGDPAVPAQERLNSVRKSLEDRGVEHGWGVLSTLLGQREEHEDTINAPGPGAAA